MIGLGIKQIITMTTILVVVLVIVGGLWYVTNLKADLAVSEMNNQKLQEGIDQQQQLMDQMRADIKSIQQYNTELNKERQKLEQDRDALTSKFSERDFGALAAEKPSLVERLINRGTVNALRCIEIASGSPLTEAEMNAKTPTEANRECPNLINPAYSPVN